VPLVPCAVDEEPVEAVELLVPVVSVLDVGFVELEVELRSGEVFWLLVDAVLVDC